MDNLEVLAGANATVHLMLGLSSPVQADDEHCFCKKKVSKTGSGRTSAPEDFPSTAGIGRGG